MKRTSILLAAALSIFAGNVQADPQRNVIGNWITSAEDSSFDEGGRYFAMTVNNDDSAFAVRCLEKQLSLGFNNHGGNKIATGDKVSIRLRTDKNPILDLIGFAINDDGMIQIDIEPETVRMIRDGKETAIRMEYEGTSSISVFKTVNNKGAFARLAKECDVDSK